MAYRASSDKRTSHSNHNIQNVLDLQPKLMRNRVTATSQVAVVVPVFCRHRKAGRFVQRLAINLAKHNAKTVLVNDGSTYWPQVNSAVDVVTHVTTKGPAAARNSGIRRAIEQGAEVILMTDADCVPNHDWVGQAVFSFIKNPYIHALSGKTLSLNTTWFDRYHEINGTLNGRRFKDSTMLLYGPTCNLAITGHLARELEFDESFPSAACEDIDYCFRLLQNGYRLIYEEAMVIRHDFQYQHWNLVSNAWRFIRQFRKYGRAESMLLDRCPSYYAYFGQTIEIPST
jgi:cellulose synthase/poly-beta-1,6-N-acetylglucosamine synthase-like glycosyltransferase